MPSRAGEPRTAVSRIGSRAVENAVYIVIVLVVLVFAFVLGALGRARDAGESSEVARLAAELEDERARVHELEAELERAQRS